MELTAALLLYGYVCRSKRATRYTVCKQFFALDRRISAHERRGDTNTLYLNSPLRSTTERGRTSVLLSMCVCVSMWCTDVPAQNAVLLHRLLY